MLALAAAVLALTGACSYERERERARGAAGDPTTIDAQLISSLEAFDACDDLLAYLRTEGAKVVGPYGFDGGPMYYATAGGRLATVDDVAEQESATAPTAAAAEGDAAASKVAGTDYSATNVQEEGVDEPDLVKTDGERLVTIAGGRLRVVDLTGPEPRLAATLEIARPGEYVDGQLLLHGDRVLVLRNASMAIAERSDVRSTFPGPLATKTTVTAVDLADLDAPKVVEEVTFDGSLVAARMVDGVARVVLRSGPPDLPFLAPTGSQASIEPATEHNRKAVAESTLEDWLPSFTTSGDDEPQRLTDCRDVSRPQAFSGVGMLTVVSVEADDPRPGPGATVVGAGETVYASAEHLYVTSTTWQAPDQTGPSDQSGQRRLAPGTTSTDVHRFSIADPVRTAYEGSGKVAGRLLNSFSMSEHEGDLRVATTDDAKMESAVSVLRLQDGALREVGVVGGLGKTEQIYAVRFLGDRGYVVTFRQTDPLYVLDLADPTKPTVTGELKIPGYSAYLHPIDEHRLLGIGQDATDQGRIQGTQVSLFDVADPAAPRQLAKATLPGSQSEAEYDHHAFLWWARTNLAVLPVNEWQSGRIGAVGFRVADDAVTEAGRVQQRDGQPIRRTVVVGDRLLTLSDSGLQANDLASLAERSWLAY
jgi:uncharacterized secreted protein with C-terminal beta-propeller domain